MPSHPLSPFWSHGSHACRVAVVPIPVNQYPFLAKANPDTMDRVPPAHCLLPAFPFLDLSLGATGRLPLTRSFPCPIHGNKSHMNDRRIRLIVSLCFPFQFHPEHGMPSFLNDFITDPVLDSIDRRLSGRHGIRVWEKATYKRPEKSTN